MAYSKVIVQGRSGSGRKGVKVVLDFGTFSGQTKPVYTDSDGVAIIEHSHTGKATVYVSGSDCGSMRTPGTNVVTLS